MTITTTRPRTGFETPKVSIGNWVATQSREYPWQTIGSVLSQAGGTGHEVDHLMTAKEVLAATGLDQITVSKVPVTDATSGKTIPRAFFTVADYPNGERAYLAPVSDKYEVVAPAEAMSVFDAVVESVDGAHYSAAWDMREKRMMGVTVELPDTIVVDPAGAADEVRLHILGVNTFDGSMSLSGIMSATRWFCTNQIVPVMFGGPRRAQRAFRFRHTANVKNRTAEAQKGLGVMFDYARKLDEVANNLYARSMTDGQFEKFLAKLPVFALDGDETDLVKNRILERRSDALHAWKAPHNENISGTRWGALNVVAEYAEWGRTVKGSKRTGTTPERQRAIGTLVHPTVTGTVDDALTILLGR